MAYEALRTALDELAEPGFCVGSYRPTERLAIALPDGDVAAVDDPMFVDWLRAHSEDAPFGHGGKTKHDPKVRNARRLVARGAAQVAGFEPAAILGEIEQALGSREHLAAELTDVLAYPAGGHFARHKDTPRRADLVGTLIVGLPIVHHGGAFEIVDAGKPHTIDWSGAQDATTLRWVALFSDADHEVKAVKSGTRVTLVYGLYRTSRLRPDSARTAQLAKLEQVARAIKLPKKRPLMIACTRHVITSDAAQPQGLDVLRGLDRDIADVMARCGYQVAVRSCITAADAYEAEQSEDRGARSLPVETLYSIARLAKAIPPKVIANFDDTVTFGDSADYEGEEIDATALGPYILDQVEIDDWVIRANAAATLLHEAEMFSDDGYFGNEGYEAHIYALAAIEVTR